MIFKKKKLSLKGAYERLGLFKIIRVTEAGHRFAVPIMEIATYYKGREIKKEPFTEELLEETIRKEIPFKIIESRPKEYEKAPSQHIILGRLELPRVGITED